MICLRANGRIGRWIKYNVYKPIRNYICHYGYGEHLSDEENTKRRREFIMGLKNDMQHKHSKKD